ncbi:ParB/RepB/Spo0J family partition protein [Comamonas piscis]|uniref:ParB/RepB/Spo0J family partition protein n=1 Tax=Comamonas piscis TaxID=1562974 RepID=A0A7G5EF41_9BURK|nr:ParB/RepB/Spo0J family partition protein [Comamonas piscis]QMV72616.1 ParB/RepB/Spo0J family partition protein [Comamonas piscis]WSO35383.1 ParB/RepB/Spo0J family partition protein [Comamonas piscis]
MATDQHDTVTQPIAINDGGATMRDLAVSSIATSLTNPRKTFDQVKLQDLANSIASMGVNMPIIVRPLPAARLQDTHEAAKGKGRQAALPEYELVAGERRWRASQLAGKSSIPAIIRQLTDAQALEVQIIENLQREDVSELEEAEGYEYLMSANQINADAVAVKIGKSRSYVFGRLKLLDLCQEARDALRNGDIDASRGLMLARIPHHSMQIEALEDVRNGSHYSTAREAKALIQRQFMLYLRNARFDTADATLCEKAGACTSCPLNTANDRDLFADVNGADMCTDSKCFQAKTDAHNSLQLKTAHEQGYEVIEGKHARELIPNNWSDRVQGYLRLDNAADSPTGEPLRALIGEHMEAMGIKPTMVANPHHDGELIAVLLPDQVSTLLAKAGHEKAKDAIEDSAKSDSKAAKAAQQAKDKHSYETTWRNALSEQIGKELHAKPHEQLPSTVVRFLARNKARGLNTEQAKQFCKLHDLGKVAPVQAVIEWAEGHCMPASALMTLMAFCDRDYRPWLAEDEANEELLALSEEVDIDVTALQTKVKANQRAEKATQKQLEDKKAAQSTQSADSLQPQEPSSTPPPAAQAQKVRGGKMKTQVDEKPKLSAAAAQAAIAEAMQAAESQSPADAAEPRDAGQGDIPGAAAAAQDDDAQAVAVAQPATVTASEDAEQVQAPAPPADTPAASGERLPVGTSVTIICVALDASLAKWGGRTGNIYRDLGDKGYEVAMPHPKSGPKKFVKFAANHVMKADHV